MSRGGDVVPLGGRHKRLRSLDEFEPPPWRRTAGGRGRWSLKALVFIAAIVGILGGLLLPV
jgi:hypothetical protein